MADRGAYLLVIQVPRALEIVPGALGKLKLKPGFYVYIGSAMRNLEARIRRHHRKDKKLHWHIDYLLSAVTADRLKSFPIRSAKRIECALVADIARLAAGNVTGFGSSDCACPSHLYYFSSDPVGSESFLDLLAPET